MNQDRQIIVGLGTGRCGTQSLSAFLSMQFKAIVLHERRSCHVRWQGSEAEVGDLLRWCRDASDVRIVGDVGFYYLPYVEYALSREPRTKFPCLQRDRTATVESYLRKTRRRNHWVRHRGIFYRHDKWDACYPKYDCSNKAQAIGRYWDDYYERAAQLESEFPANVRVFSTENLNTPAGQHQILDFLEVPETQRKIAGPVRLNVKAAAWSSCRRSFLNKSKVPRRRVEKVDG
jgi:hypothetical protein